MKKLLLALSVIAALGGFSYGAYAQIENWSTSAGSNNAAPPDGFPEGMAPSAVNNSAREVMAQVRRWAEQGVFAKYASESGGSTTAYAMTPDIAPSAYTTGALYWFVASTTNTGASTLNIAELGTKALQVRGTALSGGEIQENDVVGVVYDGTQFQIFNTPQITGVKFGTSLPATGDGLVHIHGGTAGSISAPAETDLVIEDDAAGVVTILTPSANEAGYQFGDPDDADVGRIRYSHVDDDIAIVTGGGERASFNGRGLSIGGLATGGYTNTLAIFNGTAPGASVTNGVQLFSEDVSASAELKVRDEAGNETTLSPHNFSGIPEGPSEKMAWAFYSEKDGRYVNVDMLKLARLVEMLTGEKLVYTGPVH